MNACMEVSRRRRRCGRCLSKNHATRACPVPQSPTVAEPEAIDARLPDPGRYAETCARVYRTYAGRSLVEHVSQVWSVEDDRELDAWMVRLVAAWLVRGLPLREALSVANSYEES